MRTFKQSSTPAWSVSRRRTARSPGPGTGGRRRACSDTEMGYSGWLPSLPRAARDRRVPRGARGNRQGARPEGGREAAAASGAEGRPRVQPPPVGGLQRQVEGRARGGPEGLRRLPQARGAQARGVRAAAAPQPHPQEVDAPALEPLSRPVWSLSVPVRWPPSGRRRRRACAASHRNGPEGSPLRSPALWRRNRAYPVNADTHYM